MLSFNDVVEVWRSFRGMRGEVPPPPPPEKLRRIANILDAVLLLPHAIDSFVVEFEPFLSNYHAQYGFSPDGAPLPRGELACLQELGEGLFESIRLAPFRGRTDDWLLSHRIDLLALNLLALEELHAAILDDLPEAWEALLDDEDWLAELYPPPLPLALTGAIDLCDQADRGAFSELTGSLSSELKLNEGKFLTRRPAAGGNSGTNELVVSRPGSGNPPPFVGFIVSFDSEARRLSIRRADGARSNKDAVDLSFIPEKLLLRINDMLLRPDPSLTDADCAAFTLPDVPLGEVEFEILTAVWAEVISRRLEQREGT